MCLALALPLEDDTDISTILISWLNDIDHLLPLPNYLSRWCCHLYHGKLATLLAMEHVWKYSIICIEQTSFHRINKQD
jgi:hypothetical protein